MPTKSEICYKLDKEEKIAFGKYYATSFTDIPKDYLLWIWHSVDHKKIEIFYPNLWNFLIDNYKEFTKDNLI